MRWKKNPMPTGLRRVGCGPQGSTLRDGDEKYASTNYTDGRWDNGKKGWYWVARHDLHVELKNTCDVLLPDEAAAKAEAMAYVKAQMKQAAPQPQEQS